MTRKEVESPVHVKMFNDSTQFDQFLKFHRMGYCIGTGAKGIMAEDGTIEVAINKDFFLQGGIRKNQLPAIVEHERIELTTKVPDPHLAATVGEYKFIFDRFGEKGLREYHSRLCNLYGGINDIRNQALKTIIGK